MGRPTGGYRLAGGHPVPGVTTILGRYKESGALMHWACEQGRLIERGEINNLYDARDKAAGSGTLAHEMIESYLNELPVVHPNDPAAINAFIQATKWLDETQLHVIHSEVSLVSEVHKFGGTIDAVAEDGVGGNLIMLDWKTSGSVYVDHLLQVAAYAILWDEAHPNNKINGGYRLCRFSKEHADFAYRSYADLEEAKECFLLLRRAFDIDKILKKRVG